MGEQSPSTGLTRVVSSTGVLWAGEADTEGPGIQKSVGYTSVRGSEELQGLLSKRAS